MTVIVVMGVSGSGKTTIGSILAEALGIEFADADDFHSHSNIAKMSEGHPLTDADRAPWLADIATWIGERRLGVVTSSALKRAYRDVLRGDHDVWFLHLDAHPAVLASRLSLRKGHFMPASLLASQVATLEPLQADEPGSRIDVAEETRLVALRSLNAFYQRDSRTV
ncbi:gluconokinase [Lentzea sp. JNUCC 0626]|uniref:gluconokinase n=1 Tax=Lentzea sp. JNUCC 0626 TaxID=3367513 RepID=UPI003747D68B